MKRWMMVAAVGVFAMFAAGSAEAQPYPEGFEAFEENYQFVVFAVLEGAFNEGLTQEEVDQILMRSEKDAYMHFIYACPICTASKYGFQLYAARPAFKDFKPVGFKVNNATFGDGTREDVHKRIMSDDVLVRLTVLHELVSKWIDQRVEKMQLTLVQKEELFSGLKAGRERGMEMLRGFKKQPGQMEISAPGFVNIDSCAMCDAACKIEFKPKAPAKTEAEE